MITAILDHQHKAVSLMFHPKFITEDWRDYKTILLIRGEAFLIEGRARTVIPDIGEPIIQHSHSFITALVPAELTQIEDIANDRS